MKPVSMWVTLGMSLLFVTGAMAQPPVVSSNFLSTDPNVPNSISPSSAIPTATQRNPQNGSSVMPTISSGKIGATRQSAPVPPIDELDTLGASVTAQKNIASNPPRDPALNDILTDPLIENFFEVGNDVFMDH